MRIPRKEDVSPLSQLLSVEGMKISTRWWIKWCKTQFLARLFMKVTKMNETNKPQLFHCSILLLLFGKDQQSQPVFHLIMTRDSMRIA